MRFNSLCALCLVLGPAGVTFAAETPPDRPAAWAQPVKGTTLENCFQVSEELFRSEQPHPADLASLRMLGVKTLLDLRHRHADSQRFADAGLFLIDEGMRAGDVTVDELVAALRKFRTAPKPVLVHCWHGSDRTGFFVAGYRIILQGWTREAAIDELRHGGFGFHASWYPNIVRCLAEMDVASVRRQVLGEDAGAKP
jgi:tyrosine-protein phosphatase SIW14